MLLVSSQGFAVILKKPSLGVAVGSQRSGHGGTRHLMDFQKRSLWVVGGTCISWTASWTSHEIILVEEPEFTNET